MKQRIYDEGKEIHNSTAENYLKFYKNIDFARGVVTAVHDTDLYSSSTIEYYDVKVDDIKLNLTEYSKDLINYLGYSANIYYKTIKERKKKMQNSADLLEKILKEKKLSHANLTLLIDKIIIYEDKNGLTLDINMKAPFMDSGTEFIKTLTEMPRPIKERRKRLAG